MVSRIRGTLSRRTIVVLVASLVGLCAMRGETIEKDRLSQSHVNDSTANTTSRRVREGAVLKAQLGEFREAGERIRFYLHDDKTKSFVALENLALDRVSRVLDENTTPRTWSVTGVVTEFRSGNFLLVTRATLKNRDDRRVNTKPGN